MLTVDLKALDWSVEFCNCDEVARAFTSILTGWDADVVAGGATCARRARVTRRGQAYEWVSEHSGPPLQWASSGPRTAHEVVYDLHDIAIEWFLGAHPGYLCLHGAAAMINGELLCFPSVRRAGKSTLMAAIAAAGGRVFGDDVIAITPTGEAVALGFAPRLRQPLPTAMNASLRRFVEAHSGLVDERWRYLALPSSTLAGLGERHRIGRLVLLAREGGGKPHTGAAAPLGRARARLEPIAQSAMLSELVQQNIAGSVPTPTALSRWHDVVQATPCFQLSYRRLDDAVALIRSAPSASPGSAPQRQLRRAGGFVQRLTADGTLFLAKPGSDDVHQLDPLPATVWRALRRRQSQEAVVRLVQAAFPDVDPACIAADIAVLVTSLTTRGLLVAPEPSRAVETAQPQRRRTLPHQHGMLVPE